MAHFLKDAELFREQCLIDGRWQPADEGGTVSVHNPATSEPLGTIPKMGAGETRRAIAAAVSTGFNEFERPRSLRNRCPPANDR